MVSEVPSLFQIPVCGHQTGRHKHVVQLLLSPPCGMICLICKALVIVPQLQSCPSAVQIVTSPNLLQGRAR